MLLTPEQAKVRSLLINIAQGLGNSKRIGRISYKELWRHIHPKTTWSRARTPMIVDLITNISAFELRHKRPPLNVLVTPTNKLYPTESWDDPVKGVRAHLKKLSKIRAPFATYAAAQEACWAYWTKKRKSSVGKTSTKELSAIEGARVDSSATFIKRNRKLVEEAKRRDKFRCRACKFQLSIGSAWIIDCHHKKPLSSSIAEIVTNVRDLICLCPICHRVAHTATPPLSVGAIRRARGIQRK